MFSVLRLRYSRRSSGIARLTRMYLVAVFIIQIDCTYSHVFCQECVGDGHNKKQRVTLDTKVVLIVQWYYRMNTSPTYQEITQLTRKGQVTVPAPIRKALGLKMGDKVAFTLTKTGKPQVMLQPVSSTVERTFGMLASDVAMLSPQEERQAFAEEIAG